MKRSITALVASVVVAVPFSIGASTAAGAATVLHGYNCTIGLPTPDNQGVSFTTTNSVTVITDNGAAVTHCTFLGTGYTAPPNPFPFNCNIQGIPADVTELHITPNGTIALTCVARPDH